MIRCWVAAVCVDVGCCCAGVGLHLCCCWVAARSLLIRCCVIAGFAAGHCLVEAALVLGCGWVAAEPILDVCWALLCLCCALLALCWVRCWFDAVMLLGPALPLLFRCWVSAELILGRFCLAVLASFWALLGHWGQHWLLLGPCCLTAGHVAW